ncbi:hypothetical protein PFMC_00504 [Plasmodium falciparum CAMP/Malaysia]|uniref:Uncharacterized protein n=1 Tax=Plasmodium falciparum (isolate Camp / Malaysia) TaxID=5835 RepID=A0A024XDR0_PLAFC|nr:hypothetical protein PFMC_00504 [Plasmodium falciparum CAMP/Malaysia]
MKFIKCPNLIINKKKKNSYCDFFLGSSYV